METILIQIASYKDPELPKTIADAIAKAAMPERLRFAICWQRTEEECLDPYLADRRFRIHQMHWKDAKGVGYARHICNSLYQSEDFTLQIDSHHRFMQNWDVILIGQWKQCQHPKAVISGYPPGYEYHEGKEIYHSLPPMTMVVKGFDWGLVPTFKSWHIHPKVNVERPFRGCFIAAGFMFTIGKVCKEVPYQKDVYFIGEEIVHSMRLFTHGYRIYYPNKWLIWHYYERKEGQRHWENFTQEEELKKKYDEIQKASLETIHGAMFGDPAYRHLFGKVNSIEDFERYSGVSLRKKVIHPGQMKGMEPPFAVSKGWENQVFPAREYFLNLDINVEQVPDLDDYDFWYFGVHNENEVEIGREDINDGGNLFKKGPRSVRTKLVLREIPAKYIIWPHSKSKGWQERLVYPIEAKHIIEL